MKSISHIRKLAVVCAATASVFASNAAHAGCVTIPGDFVMMADDNATTAAIGGMSGPMGLVRLSCALPNSGWGGLVFSSNKLCDGSTVSVKGTEQQCKVLSVTPTKFDPDKYQKIHLRDSLSPGGH